MVPRPTRPEPRASACAGTRRSPAWVALLGALLVGPVGCGIPIPFLGTTDPAGASGTVESPEHPTAGGREGRADSGGEPGAGGTDAEGVRAADALAGGPVGSGAGSDGGDLDGAVADGQGGDLDGTDRDDGASWVEETLAGLSLRQKVGQLMMPWVLGDYAPEGSESHDRIHRHVAQDEVGGVIISVGMPTEVAAKLNDLQGHATLPLLVAADLETGAGFRMRGAVQMPGTIDLGGATDFPSLMALGATRDRSLAYEMGRITALEARAVGIHVPFAPVLDVNNNPENPIINVRSFGEDPREVAELGAAFVRGMQEHGAIATGKHFPGHGDTSVDSHLALPVILHDRARMDSVELVPFRAAIDAGMGGIMTAHISVPALNGGVGQASTLSRTVLTDILREEMGFQGLVFTDAMDMNAVARGSNSGEAAARAIEAGADVILMPASVSGAIDGVVEAVLSGRIPEERIDASVRRILGAKASLGLHRQREVPIDRIVDIVGIPPHEEAAREVARRSITVLKNDRGLLPLAGTRSARVLSVSYRRTSDVLAGRYFNRTLGSTYRNLRSVEIDANADEESYASLLRRARESDLVVVGTYVTAVSYSGSVAIPEDLVSFIHQLNAIGVPHVVVSFGNPYLVSDFPETQAYVLAWSGSAVSQRAAAGALLGEFDTEGVVPTRVPPVYEIGDGLRLPARARRTSAR